MSDDFQTFDIEAPSQIMVTKVSSDHYVLQVLVKTNAGTDSVHNASLVVDNRQRSGETTALSVEIDQATYDLFASGLVRLGNLLERKAG